MKIVGKVGKITNTRLVHTEVIIEAFRERLGRLPTQAEIAHFEREHISRRALEHWPAEIDLRNPTTGTAPAPDLVALSDETFVEYVVSVISGRFPSPSELQATAAQLESGALTRSNLLLAHFVQAAREETSRRTTEKTVWAKLRKNSSKQAFQVMGTSEIMTPHEWRRIARSPEAARRHTTHARFPLRPRQSEVDVSVICSLWRGGNFIERYMENITSQTIFKDRCELIIIDAASPEGEGEVVQHYKEKFGDRIVYHRMPYRAGIYPAWNYGVGIAQGRYLTNANLDDLRRHDSLERQASALDALPFVDVVYDDHLYFCDPNADFETIAQANVVSELPLVTRSNLFTSNPPHNGPMWRASLHDRIGAFDETYKSAGDYDFWIRAKIGGATFYKLNEPTVAYYFNPEGLSTAATGVGISEARRALQKHGAQLIPEASREPAKAFLERLGINEWPVKGGVQVTRYALVQKKMREVARRHAAEWNKR